MKHAEASSHRMKYLPSLCSGLHVHGIWYRVILSHSISYGRSVARTILGFAIIISMATQEDLEYCATWEWANSQSTDNAEHYYPETDSPARWSEKGTAELFTFPLYSQVLLSDDSHGNSSLAYRQAPRPDHEPAWPFLLHHSQVMWSPPDTNSQKLNIVHHSQENYSDIFSS